MWRRPWNFFLESLPSAIRLLVVSHALPFPKSCVPGLDVNYVPKSVNPARKVGLRNWVLCQFLSFFFFFLMQPSSPSRVACFDFLKKKCISAVLNFLAQPYWYLSCNTADSLILSSETSLIWNYSLVVKGKLLPWVIFASLFMAFWLCSL